MKKLGKLVVKLRKHRQYMKQSKWFFYGKNLLCLWKSKLPLRFNNSVSSRPFHSVRFLSQPTNHHVVSEQLTDDPILGIAERVFAIDGF